MRVVHEKLAKQSGQAGERARRAFEASCEAAPSLEPSRKRSSRSKWLRTFEVLLRRNR